MRRGAVVVRVRRVWLASAFAVALSVSWGSPGSTAGSIPRGRLGIGDSVMLGAEDQLRDRGIRVDAAVSRQFRDAVGIVRRLKADGKLRRTLILHLGTNGVLIDPADCDRISEIAGPRRTVHLVTVKIPRTYRDVQNDRLAACALRHANTVLVDWYRHSRGHRSWFADDGYHLSATGRTRYGSFLDAKTA
jgi:hypothetical protein